MTLHPTKASAAGPWRSRRTGRARLSRTLLLVASLAVGGGLLLTPGALAANKYVFVRSFPPPYPENQSWVPSSFGSLRTGAVAVSNKNGHIYVADSGRGAVYDLESATDSTPAKWTGASTPAGSFGGSYLSVAVDNTTGDVYVADRTHAVIDKFDQNGNLITAFGDSSPSPNGQLAGLGTPAGSFAPPTHEGSSFGIAVDQATHDLYVIDALHEVIDVFDESGAYQRQITATPEGLYRSGGEYVTGIAVNALSGNVYVTDMASPGLVFEFDSSGAYVSTWDGSNTPNGDFAHFCTGCITMAVATEDATGNVFVGTNEYRAVDIFDSSGNFISPQVKSADYPGEFRIFYLTGIALDQETGYLLVSGFSQVEIFEPVVVPDVSIDPTSDVTTGGATFSGHVDPAGGGDVTTCRFEYVSQFEFRENDRETGDPWKTAAQAPCQANPPSSLPYSAPEDVSATVSGLTPGFQYHYRLVVGNAQGVNKAEGPTFATEGAYGLSTKFGSSGAGDGQLENPEDVAVDSSSGAVYVADTGNHRIVKFDSDGNFVAAWGWGVGDGGLESQVCTSGCQAGVSGSGAGQFTDPRYVDVDNSSGPSSGDVYVADSGTDLVQKFDPSGNLIASWGDGGATEFSNGKIAGQTVDDNGNLFVVTDETPYYWSEVGQDGIFRSRVDTNSLGLGSPSGGGIEIDAFGGYYETQPTGGGAGNVNYRNPGAYLYSGHQVYPYSYTSGGELVTSGLAVDRATGDLFVDQGDHIDQFLTASGCPFLVSIGSSINCAPQDSFGFGDLDSASGLVFDPSSRQIYAADPGADDVAVFARRPAPDVETGGVANQSTSSGTLTGHVDPAGAGEVVDCHFEYGTDTEYGLGNLPCTPSAPLSGPADVSADVAGLQTFTAYHYRLVAVGANGTTSYGHDRDYTPAPSSAPEVSGTSASDETPTEATLSAQVNPNFAPTTYRFQYGTGSGYALGTLASASIGEDGVDHPVSTSISGLTPGTTYHYRVLAVNFIGPTAGPDRTFNTPDLPRILNSGASAVAQRTATIGAELTPGFRPASFHVEYGATNVYGSSTPESAPVGSDNSAHAVSGALTGLAPETTYHFRFVATNQIGTTAGPDQTFTTKAEEATGPPPPPPACRKGFVRKQGKCVKRHQKHKHHKRRRRHG